MGRLSRLARNAGRELTMPAETRSPSIETTPRHRDGADPRRGDGADPRRGDGADPREGDGGLYVYVIALLAVGDAVAATFVLKTAINLLL
jgi:hypothetical protein